MMKFTIGFFSVLSLVVLPAGAVFAVTVAPLPSPSYASPLDMSNPLVQMQREHLTSWRTEIFPSGISLSTTTFTSGESVVPTYIFSLFNLLPSQITSATLRIRTESHPSYPLPSGFLKTIDAGSIVCDQSLGTIHQIGILPVGACRNISGKLPLDTSTISRPTPGFLTFTVSGIWPGETYARIKGVFSVPVTFLSSPYTVPPPTPPPTPPQPPPPGTFGIGARVETKTNNVNIRSSPTLIPYNIIGTQPWGSRGTIIEGPVLTPYYLWWYVNYDTGVDGWTAQSVLMLVTSTVPPPTPTPPPTPPPSPTPSPIPPPGTFGIGARVQTKTNNVNIRSSPTLIPHNIIGTQPWGSRGTIIEGPIDASTYRWWRVNYDTGVDGWTAQSVLMPHLIF